MTQRTDRGRIVNVCRNVCRPSCTRRSGVPKALIRKDGGEWAGRLCSGLQIHSVGLISLQNMCADKPDRPRTHRECVPALFTRPTPSACVQGGAL
jgi:hypothetical protein